MATSISPFPSAPLAGATPFEDPVPALREASRKLVREWGFLRSTLAPFPLSPGAIHCLIDIGDCGRRAFPELCAALKVTPTQLSHTLSELLSSDIIRRDHHPGGQEKQIGAGHDEIYSLTAAGRKTLDQINAYAQAQVTSALAAVPPGAGANITAAFQAYAAALEKSRPPEAILTPDLTPAATPALPLAPVVAIIPGYRPGVLARTLEMHLDFYYPKNGWGREFEVSLSNGLGDLLKRLDKPVNQVWSAVVSTPAQDPRVSPVERVVGVVYVDGECFGVEGVARLRAFIVDGSTRGLGVGKKLLGAAMEFVKEVGFRECHLSTLRSLTVARRLYESVGFEEAGEVWFEEFGKGVMELKYVWRRPAELE
jgi:ribosomal protein S18 acetylase RimI-like enzyme/DNA-binding MarR family transcriptional regulator